MNGFVFFALFAATGAAMLIESVLLRAGMAWIKAACFLAGFGVCGFVMLLTKFGIYHPGAVWHTPAVIYSVPCGILAAKFGEFAFKKVL